MGKKPGEMVQGTLEMLILKTLALEPMHGYGVALRIEQVSAGVFRVNPGSLLPTTPLPQVRPTSANTAPPTRTRRNGNQSVKTRCSSVKSAREVPDSNRNG